MRTMFKTKMTKNVNLILTHGRVHVILLIDRYGGNDSRMRNNSRDVSIGAYVWFDRYK